MSQADGSIIIDTRIDETGLSKGLKTMQTAVVAGMAAITAAIGAASVAVINLGSEFEQANAKASTLFGDAQVDMAQYQGDMLELSNKTGLAASELGNTMYDALSAGIPASDDMSEAIGFLEKNTKLAKAGFTDINTATTATAKVLNAYKMDVSETDRVHKVLMQTQNKGITTVNELGSVLSQVTPTASAMNVSFEQVGAALANMTAQGTPTAQATTQLNGLIAELGKNGTIGAKSLEKAAKGTEFAGKSFTELMKEGVPLNKVLDLMADYASKNNLSMIDMFSSIEAGKAALAVSGQNSEQFTKNLKAMGTEVDVVGEAYEKVTDTFKEKSAKVVNSLKNVGIEAYSKFEKPLKNSMDVAQKSVDELSRNMSSGKLGESVDKIADAFGDLIETGIKLATNAIPLIVNGFGFIVDHGKELTTTLVAVGGAMGAMKTYDTAKSVIDPLRESFDKAKLSLKLFEMANTGTSVAQAALNGTLTLGETAVGLLTGKISIATAAHAAWNAVKAMDPTMMIVMAVGALAAGITALCLTMDSEQKKHEETMNAIEEELQVRQSLKDQQSEQLSANLGEITNIQSLNNELKNLVDANGKVKDGYEARANFIMGELNSALGLNMELTNGEIQGYSELSSSIDDMIAKKRAEIILESQLPAYKEAVTNATNAQIEANKLNAELTELNTQSMALEAELLAEYGENWKKNYEALSSEQGQQWSNLQYDTALKQQEYNKQNELVHGYYDDITAYETNATLIASGNAEEYAKVQTNVLAAKQDTVQGQITAAENQIAADRSYIEYLKGEYDKEVDESKKKSIQAQIDSKEAVIKNEQEKIDGMKSTIINKGPEYDTEVKRLALEALNSFSGDTQKYFGVSQKKFDEVIKGLNSKDAEVKAEAEEAAKEMLEGVKSKDDEFSKAGANVLDGVINGANSRSGDLFSTMANFGTSMLESFKNSLSIKSPSRKFAALAKYIPEGIKKGIDENSDVVGQSIDHLSSNMLDRFNNVDLNSTFEAIQNAIYGEQMKMASIVDMQGKVELLTGRQEITVSNETPLIDYKKLGDAIVQSFAKSGISIKYDNREFGRIIREVL